MTIDLICNHSSTRLESLKARVSSELQTYQDIKQVRVLSQQGVICHEKT